MIGSFETLAENVLADIISAHSGIGKFDSPEQFATAAKPVIDFIHIYNSTLRPSPKHLLEVFKYAHKRYGIKYFIIDNVATMDVDRETTRPKRMRQTW